MGKCQQKKANPCDVNENAKLIRHTGRARDDQMGLAAEEMKVRREVQSNTTAGTETHKGQFQRHTGPTVPGRKQDKPEGLTAQRTTVLSHSIVLPVSQFKHMFIDLKW